MYRYDQYDHQIVKERVAQYRDQVRRRLADELTEDEFRPLRLQNGLYMQRHAYMLRIAVPYGLLSSKQMRMFAAHRPQVRPRLRPLHHAPEHPVQLDQAGRDAGHPGRTGLGRNARDPDFRQLHPQHHLRRILPASPPTRSSIRARMPKSCASGAPSIPSSPSCRASSRSPSTARWKTAPRSCVHDIGLSRREERAGRNRLPRLVGGGMGRTPILGSDDPRLPAVAAPADLYRSHPARVQPVRPPRQHVQGAHQDPGEGPRRRGIRAPGRGRMGRHQGRSEHPDATKNWTASPPTSRRRLRKLPADRRRRRAAQGGQQGLRQLDQAQRQAAQGAGLCRRRAVAEEDRRAAGRRRPPSRWTSSPTWPTATASANCA